MYRGILISTQAEAIAGFENEFTDDEFDYIQQALRSVALSCYYSLTQTVLHYSMSAQRNRRLQTT
jgi:hypothetical protein